MQIPILGYTSILCLLVRLNYSPVPSRFPLQGATAGFVSPGVANSEANTRHVYTTKKRLCCVIILLAPFLLSLQGTTADFFSPGVANSEANTWRQFSATGVRRRMGCDVVTGRGTKSKYIHAYIYDLCVCTIYTHGQNTACCLT